MFYKIMQTLQQQFNNNLGANSSYTTDKVEYVDIKVPDDVQFNRFIAIAKRKKEHGDYVMGQSPAMTFTYSVDIIAYVKHLDYNSGDITLETIEKRLLKNMADRTQPIHSLQDSSDGIDEQVVKVQLVNVDYDSGLWSDNKWAHIAIFTYQITTMYQI